MFVLSQTPILTRVIQMKTPNTRMLHVYIQPLMSKLARQGLHQCLKDNLPPTFIPCKLPSFCSALTLDTGMSATLNFWQQLTACSKTKNNWLSHKAINMCNHYNKNRSIAHRMTTFTARLNDLTHPIIKTTISDLLLDSVVHIHPPLGSRLPFLLLSVCVVHQIHDLLFLN